MRKIRIVSDDSIEVTTMEVFAKGYRDYISGQRTKVIDVESGEEIGGVGSVSWRISAQSEKATATIFFAEVEVGLRIEEAEGGV